MSNLPFRRMVIRLPQGGGAMTRPLRLVAEMARAWHLELVGDFAPDPNLGQIAGHSEMREYRLHERKWSIIERSAIANELVSMARGYERSFVQLLRSVDVHGWFGSEIRPAAGDLVVVCEPENPLEQLGWSFRDKIQMALASGSAMIAVPRHVARSRGPVVALVEAPDDPLLALGAELAAALGERLLSVELSAADDIQGLPTRLEPIAPRLLLAPRGFLDGQAEKLCFLTSACRVPALVIASEAAIHAHAEGD